MSRIVLLALAGLALVAVRPAMAETANHDPNAKTPVIVRMGEVLTSSMGAELAKEASADADATEAKATKK